MPMPGGRPPAAGSFGPHPRYQLVIGGERVAVGQTQVTRILVATRRWRLLESGVVTEEMMGDDSPWLAGRVDAASMHHQRMIDDDVARLGVEMNDVVVLRWLSISGICSRPSLRSVLNSPLNRSGSKVRPHLCEPRIHSSPPFARVVGSNDIQVPQSWVPRIW